MYSATTTKPQTGTKKASNVPHPQLTTLQIGEEKATNVAHPLLPTPQTWSRESY